MDKRKAGLVRLAIIVAAIVVAGIIWIVYTNSAHVAIVNGERISRRDFIARLEEQYGEDTLAELINETLLHQAAKKAGVEVTPEEVDKEVALLKEQIGPSYDMLIAQYGWTDEQIKDIIEMNLLVYKISTKDITIEEDALMAFFEENKSDYDEPEQVLASHILVATEEEAKEVKQELSEGADFAELAKEKSLDVATAVNGGDVGWFPRGRMTEEFEKTAFALSPGEVSGPVKTEFGYHIIKVMDRKAAREASFDEVRDDIERSLKMQQSKTAQQLVSELKLDSDITITDSKYKDLGTTTPFGIKE
ncbi:MAG TPA: peptidylprolyl isomerase [Bacillota bacterium]|nr:peptidylprolyl isomerase [Bacillota bacterium]